jgi:hypothetical protein
MATSTSLIQPAHERRAAEWAIRYRMTRPASLTPPQPVMDQARRRDRSRRSMTATPLCHRVPPAGLPVVAPAHGPGCLGAPLQGVRPTIRALDTYRLPTEGR